MMQPWIKVAIAVIWLGVGSTTLFAVAASNPPARSVSKKPTAVKRLKETVKKAIKKPSKTSPAPQVTRPPLERHYPTVIKGNWEPSADSLDEILTRYVADLKALGVNTVSIVPGYEYENSRPVLRGFRRGQGRRPTEASIKADYQSLIEQAKRAGFAVLLSPDFVGGENKDLGVNQEQFLKDLKPISLEWATIAERYQVEYYCPSSEMNWVMKKNFYAADPGNERAIAATEGYYQEILPELRSLFTGKLYFKAASQTEPMNLTGYDLLGLDFGHYGQSPDEFRKNVKAYFKAFSQSAKLSNLDWIVGELWLPYNQRGQPTVAPTGERYDDLQEDLFRIVFDEYRNFPGEPKPQGLFFIAYLMEGIEIRGRPAEPVVREFFGSLN